MRARHPIATALIEHVLGPDYLPADLRARLGFAAWSSYGHTGDPTTRFAGPGEDALGELTP